MTALALNEIGSQYLSTDGDGTGTIEATGNYSVTKGYFSIQPPANQVYVITRMNVIIRDTSITAEKYGGIASGLTNGLRIDKRSGKVVLSDLIGGSGGGIGQKSDPRPESLP